MRSFKVGKTSGGQRADVFVTTKFPGFARSTLAKLFKSGKVIANKKSVKPGQKLHAGDQLKVDDTLLHTQPPVIDLPIIFENDNVLVMDKPAGVLTHSKGAFNDEATVASFLKAKITDASLVGNRAGIVHRLDRATSGVIIGAKNANAQSHLQKQFAQRRTKKIYSAIVEGHVSPDEAIIDAPIARNPKKPQTFYVNSSGKTAQTHYRTIKNFTKNSKDYSLLELKPTSGRTHQLRVHLKYINHPIVGDPVYGKADDNLLLHAAALELTLPGSERQVFESVPPKYFKDFHTNAK